MQFDVLLYSDSSLLHIFESEKLGFLNFLYEK